MTPLVAVKQNVSQEESYTMSQDTKSRQNITL